MQAFMPNIVIEAPDIELREKLLSPHCYSSIRSEIKSLLLASSDTRLVGPVGFEPTICGTNDHSKGQIDASLSLSALLPLESESHSQS
jgi:hypothetical protein